MLLWFTDLINVTDEVTIQRPNVSTLLLSAFIRGDLNTATRGPFIWSPISGLFFWGGVNRHQEANHHCHDLKECQEVIERLLISDHIKGPIVAAFRSSLMKALDRSVKMLGLWVVTSSVTFIKSVNQSSIKPCLIVHLVAVWTLIYFRGLLIGSSLPYIYIYIYIYIYTLVDGEWHFNIYGG